MCVCVCVCVCPLSNKVDTFSHVLLHSPGECLSRETSACLNELYCVSVQKVKAGGQTWSDSCPSCPDLRLSHSYLQPLH